MKQCIKCGELKEDSLFSVDRNQCKECRKQYMKKYGLSHKKEKKQYDKHYQLVNREKIKQRQKQYYKRYRPTHVEELKQYQKQYNQSDARKITQKKQYANRRNMKFIPLINNPFPIEVDYHHILNNFHAIDPEGNWNKWFVIPMPKITHNFVSGNANNLEHWRHNEVWIRKLYDININELLG